MNVTIRLFARARDLANTDTLSLELPNNATVADLRDRLAKAHPSLTSLLERCAIARNNEFADDECALQPDDEIAILPPVSGG